MDTTIDTQKNGEGEQSALQHEALRAVEVELVSVGRDLVILVL